MPNNYMEINSDEFLDKIPNRDAMMDFFTNKMQLYCPKQKEMNGKFISDVIAEKKFLLPLKKMQRVFNIP